MKSIIEKFRVQNDSFPKVLTIVNGGITDKKSIAEKFNRFFVNVGTNLATKMHVQSILNHTFQILLPFFEKSV